MAHLFVPYRFYLIKIKSSAFSLSSCKCRPIVIRSLAQSTRSKGPYNKHTRIYLQCYQDTGSQHLRNNLRFHNGAVQNHLFPTQSFYSFSQGADLVRCESDHASYPNSDLYLKETVWLNERC